MPSTTDTCAAAPRGISRRFTTKAIAPLPALTGLRIFAALAVYASHVGPPHGVSGGLKAFFESGYMGVTLFFVLSGFVLTINYFERLRAPTAQAIQEFGVARFARIYPLYILILFYILVRQHAFGGSIGGWWEHVLMIQAWDPNIAQAYNFDGPAWSLSVEFFLYACFPFLIVILTRIRATSILLVTAIGVASAMVGIATWFTLTNRSSLPWTDPESAHRWLYVIPVTRLGDFLLGILAGRLYVELRKRASLVKSGGLLAITATVAIVALMAWPANVFSAWSWDVAYAIPCVVLIFGLAIAPSGILARLLSLPALVLLGESSYAFYLIHQPGLQFFDGGRWALALSATTATYEALTLGAIICLAIGLHVAVERPARLYIRRLSTKHFVRAQNIAVENADDPDQIIADRQTAIPLT